MGLLNMRRIVAVICILIILMPAVFAIYGGGQPSSPASPSSPSSGGGGGGGSTTYACNDNKDNDNDGLVDYPEDPGCLSKKDNDEADPVACNENWICDAWSGCSNGLQTRECADLNACGTADFKPSESKTCEEEEEVIEPVSTPEPVEEEPVRKVGTGLTGAVTTEIPRAVTSKYTLGAILLVLGLVAVAVYSAKKKKKHF